MQPAFKYNSIYDEGGFIYDFQRFTTEFNSIFGYNPHTIMINPDRLSTGSNNTLTASSLEEIHVKLNRDVINYKIYTLEILQEKVEIDYQETSYVYTQFQVMYTPLLTKHILGSITKENSNKIFETLGTLIIKHHLPVSSITLYEDLVMVPENGIRTSSYTNIETLISVMQRINNMTDVCRKSLYYKTGDNTAFFVYEEFEGKYQNEIPKKAQYL